MLPVYVLRFFLLSHMSVVLLWAVNVNGHHDECPDSFDCGSLGTIRFPFTKAGRQDCGALEIYDCDQKHAHLKFGGKRFQVTKIKPHGDNPIVYVIDDDLGKLLESGNCKAFGYNITLPPSSPLGNFSISNNITIFKCNHSVSTPGTFFKNTSCGYDMFFGPPDSDYVPLGSVESCPTVHLPTIDKLPISAKPFAFLTAEIPIQFNPSNECSQCDHHDHDGRRGPSGRCFLDSKGEFYCARRYAITQ